MNDTFNFNVLTDPWIPLDDGTGNPASFIGLIMGHRDAPDLIHPRDDCRFFARMLLSALAQALFPAKDATELRTRIETPLPKEQVLERVEEVRRDFELANVEMPWMLGPQLPGDTSSDNETARLFLDVPRNTKHLLFWPGHRHDGMCCGCAVVIVSGLQAFATPDGSTPMRDESGRTIKVGFGSSISEGPRITTLVVDPRSVRKSVWLNTLSSESAQRPNMDTDPNRISVRGGGATETGRGARSDLLKAYSGNHGHCDSSEQQTGNALHAVLAEFVFALWPSCRVNDHATGVP